jgi:tetratricopeptide (TPR) repeat protein
LGRLLLRTAVDPSDFAAARTHLLRAAAGSAALPPEGRFHAYLGSGQSYARQGRWKEARLWLERAQPLAPLDPIIPYELATVYRRLGDAARYARARERHRAIDAYQREARALTEKVAARPDDLHARLRLARLHARHGALVDAIKSYRFLLLRAPNQKVTRQEYEALTRRYGVGAPPSP